MKISRGPIRVATIPKRDASEARHHRDGRVEEAIREAELKLAIESSTSRILDIALAGNAVEEDAEIM